MRARIPTLAAASTALQTHCPRDRPQDFIPGMQIRINQATNASVWITTSFRQRPRMQKHANDWWSFQLHTLCAIHKASLCPALASNSDHFNAHALALKECVFIKEEYERVLLRTTN
jgi:hypothetical protein